MKKKTQPFFDAFGNNELTNFEKTFSYLKEVEKILPNAKICFDLLKKLNIQSTDLEADTLIEALHKIKFASNTTSCFYFYFPLVTHILYYKPQREKEILQYLIGPNFANGTSETNEMIEMIIGAMKFKLNENQDYLSKESQHWIINELTKLEKQIEREIQSCWNDLD